MQCSICGLSKANAERLCNFTSVIQVKKTRQGVNITFDLFFTSIVAFESYVMLKDTIHSGYITLWRTEFSTITII